MLDERRGEPGGRGALRYQMAIHCQTAMRSRSGERQIWIALKSRGDGLAVGSYLPRGSAPPPSGGERSLHGCGERTWGATISSGQSSTEAKDIL